MERSKHQLIMGGIMSHHRLGFLTLILLILSSSAFATGTSPFSTTAPAKVPGHDHPALSPTGGPRQGGDTIADAIPVEAGQTVAGTTVGFSDDYDEACPFSGSTSPDVVYGLVPQFDECLTFDLAGSGYDTKIYIYRDDLTLMACNDDFYPDYVSRIDGVLLEAGTQYYVIIDGYGGDAGNYQLTVSSVVECGLDCGDWTTIEMEPELVDGYIDTYNGGCNSLEHTGEPVLQPLNWYGLCATTGWYVGPSGGQSRDTDWFTLQADPGGFTEVTMDADVLCRFFVLEPGNCDDPMVIEEVVFGPCDEQTITLESDPDHVFWFVVVPDGFTPPVDDECFGDGEYNYVLHVDGWDGTTVEARSLSAVKGLFH